MNNIIISKGHKGYNLSVDNTLYRENINEKQLSGELSKLNRPGTRLNVKPNINSREIRNIINKSSILI